ncbi:MAG: adenine nucleotide alpha hydrolase [Planctomycetia bacterium]|nr:adenine nucleotide alpha hydrolase [Planctomycetia bacterium]
MSWSGGKDSALALYELIRGNHFEIVALMTTVSEEYQRISHHGVREVLLDAQAEAIGLPLAKVYLPSNNSHPCTNSVYEDIMGQVLQRYKAQGVTTVGFGDLFLADLRAWREKNLAQLEMKAVFPLWKRDTTALAQEVISLGFKSYLSCVEGKVGPGFVGRPYDQQLLRDLPATVDPCGEYGEFHSFVYDGPIFHRPVDVEVGQIVVREGRYYADLLPANLNESRTNVAAQIPPVM